VHGVGCGSVPRAARTVVSARGVGKVVGHQRGQLHERPPGCGTQPLQINLGAFGQVLVEGDGVDGPDPSIEVSHELAEVDCARPGKGRGDHHHRALRQMPVALCFQLCSVALSAAHLPQLAAVFAAPQSAAALPPPMETKVHSVVVSPPLQGKEPMTVLGGSLDWCYRWP